MKLSVIVVHYKTPELLLACVRSVVETKGNLTVEVIVVDNDSQDSSESLVKSSFPDVIWINSGYNAGFARGNNTGIRKASGEFILLLNPDSYIKSGFLTKLINYYQTVDADNSAGLLGCRIISPSDNTLLVGTGINFPSVKKLVLQNPLFLFLKKMRQTPIKSSYDPSHMHYHNHIIDFVSGACVMIKKNKIDRYNLFLDEDFFLYSEDVEWSFRTKRKGLVNHFCADVEIYHVNSASTKTLSEKKIKQILLSRLLFVIKSYGVAYYLLYISLISFNFLLGWLIYTKNKLLKKAALPIEKELFINIELVIKWGFILLFKYSFNKKNRAYLKYD